MLEIHQQQGYFIGRFQAMASPCEVLVDTEDAKLAEQCITLAAEEAARVETKLSRYRNDNIIHQINTANGAVVRVDEETARLLDYAAQLYELSDGKFDVTSGILRRVWRFDGSDNIPVQRDIDTLLPLIGWSKVSWHNPELRIPAGMEIDLGGIGKEYAVDSAVQLIRQRLTRQHTSAAALVNFGGDIAVTGPRPQHAAQSQTSWQIGVDTGRTQQAPTLIQLSQGAIATSGDAWRYLLKDGVRYSHVLNPHTGWPVPDAPASVTVAANTCTEAGMLSTFALLQGSEAENFLRAQNVLFWCTR